MTTQTRNFVLRIAVLAVLAGCILGIMSAYPQFKLRFNQNGAFEGHYAYNDIDEVAYAAYLQALIDGRPRRNDPYSGKDDSAARPQPESLFSIQFASPYLVALPARLVGADARGAMLWAGILAAFFSAIFAFILIWRIVGDEKIAFAGALLTLCCGALFAGEGAIGEVLGTGFPYPYFPFLRRYVPAVPFPFFFLFLIAVWEFLNARATPRKLLWGTLGLACFSFLVFSYFYIWTAAAAFSLMIFVLLLVFRPENWKPDLLSLALFGFSLLIPLAGYGYLLAGRSETMDNVQLLVLTHQPDLTRWPILIGLLAIMVLMLVALFRNSEFRTRRTVLTMAAGITPLLLFNQQVITGRSLQPIHYQVFIGNYIAGLALALAIGALLVTWKPKKKGFLDAAVLIAGFVFAVWGIVECHYTVRVLDEANQRRDQLLPIARSLKSTALRDGKPFDRTLFTTDAVFADDAPTVAPPNVLWARHQHVFAGLSWEENRRRYFFQLYYSDATPEWLDHQLRNGNFVAMISLFGWGRHTDRLSFDAKPLTSSEIVNVVGEYRRFSDSFSAKDAESPHLDYFVKRRSEIGFENLRKWYRMDILFENGDHQLYRLTRLNDG
ncbi:MAG: hypothetical protein R2684_14940 [Pyrinomonadaceae bacterium]